MVVYDQRILIDLDFSVFHLTDSDSSYKLIVVNRRNEKLRLLIGVSLRCRNKINNALKERFHVHIGIFQIFLRKAVFRGSKEEGAVQLLIGCI